MILITEKIRILWQTMMQEFQKEKSVFHVLDEVKPDWRKKLDYYIAVLEDILLSNRSVASCFEKNNEICIKSLLDMHNKHAV